MKRSNIIAKIGTIVGAILKMIKSLLRFSWTIVSGSVRRMCFLIRTWNKSRKEISNLRKKESAALATVGKIKTDTDATLSTFVRDVASAQTKARSARTLLEKVTREVLDCGKEFQQRTQVAAARKAEPELSKLRRQVAQSNGEATSAKNRCRDSFELLENRINEIESGKLCPLENNAKELLNLLVTWIKTPRMQQGKTIANVFDAWWKDHYAGYLETADELNSRLGQLPDEFNGYTIQFKVDQRRLWLEPNDWAIDNDGNLVLRYSNDEGDPFTVEVLQSLLNGDTTDSYGNSVNGDMEVRLELQNSGRQYRPLNVRFSISRNKELIVITMDNDDSYDDDADATTGYGNGYEEEYVDDANDDNNDDGDNDNDKQEDNDDPEKDHEKEYVNPEEPPEEDPPDDVPEHEFDPTRKGSDLDQAFLETANDLFERLDELPRKCGRFKVRFVAVNSDNWIIPEEWHLDDDDGSLIFGLVDDGNDHEEEDLTIADLKNILTGGCDDGEDGVEEDTHVYIDDPDSDNYYRLLDEYFNILWKHQIVDIPMIEDDHDSDDEESEDDAVDGDDENDDERDEDDDIDEEDEEYDEDDDESDEEDEDDAGEDGIDDDDDDDGQPEEDDDEEEEQDEECGEDGNGGNKPSCDLTLGLIMERGFQNWLHGK